MRTREDDDDEPDTDPWEDDPDEAEWEDPTPRWEEPADEPQHENKGGGMSAKWDGMVCVVVCVFMVVLLTWSGNAWPFVVGGYGLGLLVQSIADRWRRAETISKKGGGVL